MVLRKNWYPAEGFDTLSLFQAPVQKRVLGIDLKNRGHEVRKIFFAGFARQAFRNGYDPEDVLQEVYKALLIRNNGICPWDPAKSSFAHYVHMVCNGTFLNYYRKLLKHSKGEQIGLRDADGEYQDSSLMATEEAPQEESYAMSLAKSKLIEAVREEAPSAGLSADHAGKCLAFLVDGYKNKEIAAALKINSQKVTDLVRFVRRVSEDWAEENVR